MNNLHFIILVDPDTATTILLKKIDMFYNTKTNDEIIGKNKVLLYFNSDSLYNGTGFKAEVRTSTYYLNKISIFSSILLLSNKLYLLC